MLFFFFLLMASVTLPARAGESIESFRNTKTPEPIETQLVPTSNNNHLIMPHVVQEQAVSELTPLADCSTYS